MKFDKEFTGGEIDYLIKKYKEERTTDNLCKLMIGLSDATVQVPVTIETNTNINEKNGVISPMGIYPAVVYTDDNYSWFCCFTREQEIIKEFKEKYTVLEFKFEDLMKDVFDHDDVDGIAINCFSELHIHLDKQILDIILNKDYLKLAYQ